MGLPSGQDGPGLRSCDKCGQLRRTTQVDPSNGGPWLCAGCVLSYAPGRQAGNEAPVSAASRRGRRLSSLGQSTITQAREHGEGKAGTSLSRTSSSAATFSTSTAVLQRSATSGNLQATMTDFTSGIPLDARAKMPPRSGTLNVLTQAGSEQTSSSRSRLENLRGSTADAMQTAIPREVFKPKLVSALTRKAEKAREALEEREREQQASRDKHSHHRSSESREQRDHEKREREHKRRLEVAVVEAFQSTTNGLHEIHEEKVSSPPSNQCHRRKHQGDELLGGFRRGDVVCSLVSRERRNAKVLELGHNGEVISVQLASRLGEHPMLLVQFALGFDWLLSPHQICSQADYNISSKSKLPGGFHWGDRVRTIVDGLVNERSKRGLSLGDSGTVVGPGHSEGKVAVHFDGDVGEWNVWPGVLCLAEAYPATLLANLAGSFRRGDRVKVNASTKGDASKLFLQAGEEGIVVGPGHVSSRILVKFDIGDRTWSMRPSQISFASVCDITEPKEFIKEAPLCEEQVS